MSDYTTLSDRQLDSAIAEGLMGFEPDIGPSGIHYGFKGNRPLPEFSTDDNAARMIRNRIAELGLDRKFLAALKTNTAHLSNPTQIEFCFLNSTPRQQSIAALKALDAQEGSTER